MPSWQARLFDHYVRLRIRRRHWGNDWALARRARRLFGAPPVYRHLVLWGLRRERVAIRQGHKAAAGLPGVPAVPSIRGEWIRVTAATAPPPSQDATPGVLLYVHGGGYVSCSSATHRPITAALARTVGCPVFSTDYRRAPETRFPAALEDVLAVYHWLLTEGAPGAPIAVAGESAGGGLVLALALHARAAGWPAPACVAALSPWTDLAGTGASLRTNEGRCAMFYPENIPAFASVYLDGASAQDPRASPLYAADLRGLPPVLLQVGSTELLLEDARRMHERLLAAGGASRLSIYEDVVHGWQLLTPLIPEACAAVQEVADFLRVHLGVHRVGAGTVERPLSGPVGLTCRWDGVHRGTGAAFRSFMSRHTSVALSSKVRILLAKSARYGRVR